MDKQPIIYYQTDARWKLNDYSAKGEKTTIGASGCGPTSMAMVLATLCDKKVTPATECNWALKNGYKCPHSGTYYGYFVPAGKRYNLNVTRINTNNIYGNSSSVHHATAKKEIDNGNLVIACMGKGTWTSSGHYILVWKISGNTIYINDPASSKAARVRGDYSVFKKQVKYYWAIEVPKTTTTTSTNKEEVLTVQEATNNAKKENELDMTKKEFLDSVTGDEVLALLKKAEVSSRSTSESEWSKKEGSWQAAINDGLVDGSNPTFFITREQAVAVITRFINKIKK